MNLKTHNPGRIPGQFGFTLIELMIVVTIIGILASIGIPAYRDYTIRTRVAECASVFGPVKTAIAIHLSQEGAFPATLTAIDPLPNNVQSFKGDYVSNVTVAAGGVVYCNLKTETVLGEASGDAVVWDAVSVGGTLRWPLSGTLSTVPDKYQPETG